VKKNSYLGFSTEQAAHESYERACRTPGRVKALQRSSSDEGLRHTGSRSGSGPVSLRDAANFRSLRDIEGDEDNFSDCTPRPSRTSRAERRPATPGSDDGSESGMSSPATAVSMIIGTDGKGHLKSMNAQVSESAGTTSSDHNAFDGLGSPVNDTHTDHDQPQAQHGQTLPEFIVGSSTSAANTGSATLGNG
jgi:hypothetical protein